MVTWALRFLRSFVQRQYAPGRRPRKGNTRRDAPRAGAARAEATDAGGTMEKILIGKITSPSGLKGEVRVYNYSDGTRIYEETESLYVGDVLRRVRSLRRQKNMLVISFEGIDDRDAAERARGLEVFATDADLPPLEEGEFYVRDLIGMEVAEEDGNHLGRVSDVIQNTAQDILEVREDSGRTFLIPKVDAFVLDIDGDERRITVRLQEGLREL